MKGGRPTRRLYVLLASAVIATLLIALTMSTVSAQEGVSKRYGAIAAVPSLVRGVDGYGATLRQAKRAAIKECRQFASHRRKYAGDCQGAVWVRNGWIAIAFERTVEQPYSELAWGSGWGHRKDSAKDQARNVCRRYAQEKCEVQSVYETPVRDPSVRSKGGSW